MSAMARDESGGCRRGPGPEMLLIDEEGVPTLAVGEGNLGRSARLRLHQGGAATHPASGPSIGWVVVLAAALFFTAFVGVAQIVAGEQASVPDDDVLANLANVD